MTDNVAASQGPQQSLPRTEFNALSIIQKYSLIESGGGTGGVSPLHDNFFDADHRQAFAHVGLTSARHASVIWVVAYVIIGAIAYALQGIIMQEQTTSIGPWTFNVSPLYWVVKFASFSTLLVSTGVCLWASRFYTGNVPKKALNTWFITRGTFLIAFSVVTFFCLGMIYKYLLNDQAILSLYRFIEPASQGLAYKVCNFLYSFLRGYLFEAGMAGLLASCVAAVLPYLGVVFFRLTKRRKKYLDIRRRG